MEITVPNKAYSPIRNQLFSGGFDDQIYLWEMNSLTALTIENSTVTCTNLTGAHNSLYSIDTNPAGTIVAAGGTEKQIRLWDPRTQEKLMKLKGHKARFIYNLYKPLSKSEILFIFFWEILVISILPFYQKILNIFSKK